MKIGSLFSGYGGLDMGVKAALGGETAWFVEYDKAPSKILAHHWPNVPNYGDVTAVDWSQVEPVDIITGGSPCQDLSHAGKRQGMTEGTRSNLWVAMREAIAQLRPSLVVWENVRGAYSAEADSDLELCPRCVGDPRDRGPVLRALGRVLGDLSDLGYDCRAIGLRAADVGAPHGRFRVFVVASDAERGGWGGRACDAGRGPLQRTAPGGHSQSGGSGHDGALLPTPRTTDGTKGGPNQRDSSGDLMLPSAVTLLGTPRASDWKGCGPIGSKSHEHMHDRDYLTAQVQRLLPTPTSADSKASGAQGYNGNEFCTLTNATVRNPQDWGIYADAIARWETLTRPAPAPTQPSKKGTPQLSPAFSEWLMGLPAGHVTDIPGLSRNDQLKALGNGVVPQQAAAAIRYLLSIQEIAA